MAIKFGTKAYSVLGTAVVSLALVAGCNTEEAAPDAGKPSTGPSTAAPPKSSDPKPAPAAPPVTPPKEDAKPK